MMNWGRNRRGTQLELGDGRAAVVDRQDKMDHHQGTGFDHVVAGGAAVESTQSCSRDRSRFPLT